jgi:hypothetical protein
MKGIWVWPSDPKQEDRVLRRVRQEDDLAAILAALAKNQNGLSNAQIDNLLANNSQWRTLWHMRELIALGLVEYKAELFGEPGRYTLTERGKTLLPKIVG